VNPLLDAALAFHAAGCSVIPARVDGTKAPAVNWRDYQSGRAGPEQLRAWLDGGAHDGFGVVCGAVSGQLEMLELESRAMADGLLQALAAALADHGLDELWQRITRGYLEASPSGGLHLLYRVMDGAAEPNTKLARAADRQVLIETRGEGGYVVVAPSGGRTHPSGAAWALLAGGPATIAAISAEERDALHAIARLLDASPTPAPAAPATPSGPYEGGLRPGDDYSAKATWEEILGARGWVVVGRHGAGLTWRRPGKNLGVSATTGTRGDGDNLYVFTSSTEFEPEVPYSKFAAFTLLEHGGDYTVAARELRRLGYGDQRSLPQREAEDLRSLVVGGPVEATEGALATVTELRPRTSSARTYSHSDDRNALDLIDAHGHEIRYCPDRGRWLTWSGRHWQWAEAGGGTVREHARTLARALDEAEAAARKFKASSLSNRGITSTLALAQTDPRAVVAAELLDAHPHELNTPGGIVDLLTGTTRPGDPGGLHTRMTAVAPDDACPIPRWRAFLAETFGGDEQMIAFVRRLAGYSASADVRHHVLPFLHGGGQNGKSVLMDVLRKLLGDYATTAPPGFLMQGRQEHLAEVARLQGLRLVVASEVNQDAKFDEAKLKELTGGDSITARFMRQDFFTFEPTHHLWLMGNHKPAVRTGGDSFWRRLRLIPFNHKVPDNKTIENLADLLVTEEGPGILAWIIAGAVDVFAHGLGAPASVMAETKAYAAEEDQIGRFLEERCEVGDILRTESKELRAAYERWCASEGEKPLPASPLGRELKLRGIEKVKSNGRLLYTGVALIVDEESLAWDDPRREK
jgi:P4 family phage/plasmid primase-like protien